MPISDDVLKGVLKKIVARMDPSVKQFAQEEPVVFALSLLMVHQLPHPWEMRYTRKEGELIRESLSPTMIEKARKLLAENEGVVTQT